MTVSHEMAATQESTEQPDFKSAKEQQYGQTKRASEHTTEDNKMELLNLPAHTSFQIVKNLLERRFKIEAHKIRLASNKAYLAFKTQEERDDAILKLNGQEWKGRKLAAKATIARDDLLAKRRRVALDTDNVLSADSGQDETITDEQINAQVCPLYSLEYPDQLKMKENMIRSVLNMSKQIHKMSYNLKNDAPKLYEWAKQNDKLCCQFDGVVPSPVITGYRNKCEFSISREGKIGFKMGRYRNGSERVCRPPTDCPIVTEHMFKIMDLFEKYLQTGTTLKGFDLVTHEGNYRQITIRCNSNDEYLIIIDFHPQDMDEVKIENEITQILDVFKSMEQIVSIYVNLSNRSAFSSANQNLRLIKGDRCLFEKLSVDLARPSKFRIGPGSFFQVNTQAAELLYRSIMEVANLNSSSMVLDVGCGTGTIGLSLASKVNHVIGIEIVPSAIEDAKANAEENGIDNVTFYAGKAEELIGESIKILKKKLSYQQLEGEIVAIVDPPRNGFNNSFIKTLRSSNIKKIVYIACDPKANTNLLTLCRPTSKAYQGDPFVPVRAIAFDLFPHTNCCELLIVYERLSSLN